VHVSQRAHCGAHVGQLCCVLIHLHKTRA
jgi:hypothetical protein